MFSFWKKKDDFELLLKKACTNLEAREAFHQRLLSETLYVLTAPKLTEDTELFITGANDKLQVLCLEGNRFPVFTSEDRIFESKKLDDHMSYAAISGQVIFKLFQENSIIINPYSKNRKEFCSEEIRDILNKYAAAAQTPLYLH